MVVSLYANCDARTVALCLAKVQVSTSLGHRKHEQVLTRRYSRASPSR